MLKIVVFDGGWGGAIVADYLADELKIAEVIPVIDWAHAPYDNKTLAEVCCFAETAIAEYIGKADLIVMGGYTTSYALGYLRRRYRQQQFVGMDINYHRILRMHHYPTNITVMMNDKLIETTFCDHMRQKLPFSTISVPDCTGWEGMINNGVVSMNKMRGDLGTYFQIAPRGRNYYDANESIVTTVLREKYDTESTLMNEDTTSTDKIPSDVVLLLNTNFWEVKSELEKIFGYGVRVMDFRQKLLHDVCAALNLLGVDGQRSK